MKKRLLSLLVLLLFLSSCGIPSAAQQHSLSLSASPIPSLPQVVTSYAPCNPSYGQPSLALQQQDGMLLVTLHGKGPVFLRLSGPGYTLYLFATHTSHSLTLSQILLSSHCPRSYQSQEITCPTFFAAAFSLQIPMDSFCQMRLYLTFAGKTYSFPSFDKNNPYFTKCKIRVVFIFKFSLPFFSLLFFPLRWQSAPKLPQFLTQRLKY